MDPIFDGNVDRCRLGNFKQFFDGGNVAGTVRRWEKGGQKTEDTIR